MPGPSTRLVRHGMRHRGLVWNGTTYVSRVEGIGLCECGETSPVLKNAAQRKAWHRAHKDEKRKVQD